MNDASSGIPKALWRRVVMGTMTYSEAKEEAALRMLSRDFGRAIRRDMAYRQAHGGRAEGADCE